MLALLHGAALAAGIAVAGGLWAGDLAGAGTEHTGGAFDLGARAALAGDYAGAMAHWLPLAEAGDRDAQYNVGNLHDRGLGLPEDDLAAIDWYGRAAAQGSVEAMVNLGMLYEAGRGVARDMTAAAEWFRRAAEAGNSLAQFKLGEAYAQGLGLPADPAQAAYWYRRAIERDLAAAMYRLGTMMATGQGIAQDVAQANALYERAEATSCMIRGHEHEPLALRTRRDQVFLGG